MTGIAQIATVMVVQKMRAAGFCQGLPTGYISGKNGEKANLYLEYCFNIGTSMKPRLSTPVQTLTFGTLLCLPGFWGYYEVHHTRAGIVKWRKGPYQSLKIISCKVISVIWWSVDQQAHNNVIENHLGLAPGVDISTMAVLSADPASSTISVDHAKSGVSGAMSQGIFTNITTQTISTWGCGLGLCSSLTDLLGDQTMSLYPLST